MKQGYFLFLLLNLVFVAKAQTFSCGSAQYNCGPDMTDSIYSYIDHEVDSSVNNTDPNFLKTYRKRPKLIGVKNDPYYKDDNTGTKPPCGSTTGCDVSQGAFTFYAYYPKKTFYTHYDDCPLPCIFIFHGGAYSDCSSLEASVDIKYICQLFAQRRFVAFDVEYRRGSLLADPDLNGNPNLLKTAQQQLAAYRAVQDVRGAIRSIIKMSDDHRFDAEFKIDKNKIFLGGASAGSGAVINSVYAQYQDMVDDVSPGIKPILGSIDDGDNADFYYAPYNYTVPDILGVMDMWGELALPGNCDQPEEAYAFFNRNRYFPALISFHGDDDPITTPTDRKENYPTYAGEIPSRASTTQCLNGMTYTVTPSMHTLDKPSDLHTIGTLALRDLLLQKGKKVEAYIDCQMGHGLDCDPGTPNCTTPFLSNFGTTYTNQRDVTLYMVQRAAVFFQSVLAGTTIPGANTFINCVNTRKNVYNSGAGTCQSQMIVFPSSGSTACQSSCVDCREEIAQCQPN